MTKFKKKILLIGPIGDFGGRELETGFIAKSLSANFDIIICSTGNLSTKSQVFDFVHPSQVYSLNNFVYSQNLRIRIASFFSWIKNNRKLPIRFYVKSKYAKKFLGIEKHIKKQIEIQIKKSDCVLICAQLSSNYIETIIGFAYQFEKPIFFRTTGTIEKLTKNQSEYLRKVAQFIHHSEANALNLNSQEKLPYVVIDQCAYNEQSLLQIELLKKKVTTFITIARLEKEKNIDVVIKAFLKIKENGDKLIVVGNGSELKNLKELAFGEESILFTCFVPNAELNNYLGKSDCVIISSDYEAGPLTGIEAMAAGKIIISAKIGAMPERIPENEFWFSNTVGDLIQQMQKVKKMEEDQITAISTQMRKRYQENYSGKCIEASYNNFFTNHLS